MIAHREQGTSLIPLASSFTSSLALTKAAKATSTSCWSQDGATVEETDLKNGALDLGRHGYTAYYLNVVISVNCAGAVPMLSLLASGLIV